MKNGKPPRPHRGSEFLRRRIAATVWVAVIFSLSSWPNPPEPPELLPGLPGLDKLTHLVLYGMQGFLLYRAVRWPGRPGLSLARIAAIVGSLAVLGTVDEIHQVWIPGRGMEWGDFFADLTGGALGAALASLRSSRLRSRHPERSEGSCPRRAEDPSALRASG